MKKFITQGISIIVVFYIMLMLLQKVVDYGLIHSDNDLFSDWNLIFKKELSTDLIILGNSRASVHLNPELIEKETGIDTYNIALSGTSLNIFKIRWKSYINNNKKPKIVILNVDLGTFGNQKNIFSKVQYIPFFDKIELKEYFKVNDKDYYKDLYIPMFKYRQYEMFVFEGIGSYFIKTDSIKKERIFFGVDKEWNQKDYLNYKKIIKNEEKQKLNMAFYENGFKILNEMILDCNNMNLKLVLVWSPEYYESIGYRKKLKDKTKIKLKEIAESYNHVYYWDYTQDSICYNRDYFYNSKHLNIKGANIYSKNVSNDLNKYILN